MLSPFSLALRRLSNIGRKIKRGIHKKGTHTGQGLVEYALIIAFIGVVVIVSMTFLQGRISGLFSKVGNSLDTGVVAAPASSSAAPNACPAGQVQMTGTAFAATYGHVSGSNRDVGQVEVPPGSNNWFLCVNTTVGGAWYP